MRQTKAVKRTRLRRTSIFLSLLGVAVALGWLALTPSHKRVVSINDSSTTLLNVQYCNSKNPSLALNLYYPKGEVTAKLPLVVYIHGGGWLRGDESGPLLETYGTKFVKQGIAVAAIDYRLDAKNPYPDQNDDIACALSYLTTNADRLSIDTQKIIYFGDSAGGQLAACAALSITCGG